MPKIEGLTFPTEFKLPDWLESLFGEESATDLLHRFKESAEAYELALSDLKAALDTSKRVVSPAYDRLLKIFKEYFDMRLTILEQQVADFMNSVKVSQPQPRAIIIFEGKGKSGGA
jgi:hypothetical protein